jgi:hypothetical protein
MRPSTKDSRPQSGGWLPSLGALGGFLGAALGHLAVVAAFELTGDASVWFKGPHGPPFFSLLAATAVFYGVLGAFLAPAGRRLSLSGIAFLVPALTIYAPMAVATRVFSWGSAADAAPTLKWFYLVLGVYALASTSAAAVIGARVCGRRGALAAVAGLAAATAAGMIVKRFVPVPAAAGWLPPLGSLADGVLTGFGIGAALAAALKIPAPLKSTGGSTMKKAVAAAVLLAVSAPAYALGTFALPAIKPLRLSAPVGQRPAVTRLPFVTTLDSFRLARTVVPLGSKQYHVALQRTRGGEWAVSLLEVGKRKLEFEAATLLSVIEKKSWKRNFGGLDYTVRLNGDALDFAADEHPLRRIRVPLRSLRLAVYDAAVPAPSLGPDWRVIVQIDLFRGGGMRSVTFLHAAGNDVSFYRVGAEGIGWTRKVKRSFADRHVALWMVDGDLMIETVAADAPAVLPLSR